MASEVKLQSPRRQLLAGLPVKERRLPLAGISTAVLEAGEGRPVVLLHGPMAYAAHWMGVIPGLAHDHSVIVPDLPGHGASQTGDVTLDVPRVLAWLDALIGRTCPQPPVMVGQLLGGAIALRFAIEQGERLERLVLVDTFGLAPFQPAPEFGQALMQFQAQPNERNHDALWRHCAYDLDALRRRMGAQWLPFSAYNVERARTPGVRAAVHALMQGFGLAAIAPDELARMTVPTSLIWGRNDLVTALAVAEAASKRFRWPLEIIDNANDDPPIEQPEVVLRALRAAIGRGERCRARWAEGGRG